MAEIIAILSTSWRLVRAINAVLQLLEQTREHTRAFRFLERQAAVFLQAVQGGLAGVDPSPYLSTILSLEGLLRDILNTSSEYAQLSRLGRFLYADRTKLSILRLNERLRFFVDTYMIQTATHNARINLETFSRPLPPQTTETASLIPDDLQWEIMSQGYDSFNAQHSRILSWKQGLVSGGESVGMATTTQPPPIAPLEVQSFSQEIDVAETPVRAATEPTNCELCCQVWLGWLAYCWPNILCLPLRACVCLCDCCDRLLFYERTRGHAFGYAIRTKADRDAIPRCTRFMLTGFPICKPDLCIKNAQGCGVRCADGCAGCILCLVCNCCCCVQYCAPNISPDDIRQGERDHMNKNGWC